MKRWFCYVVDWNLSFLIVLFLFFSLSGGSAIAKGEVFEKDDPNIVRFKECIVWNTEYSAALEHELIKQFSLLPPKIQAYWLEDNGKVYVCPNKKGYLDITSFDEIENTVIEHFFTKNDYVVASNQINSVDGKIISSSIYILGDKKSIQDAFLHEIGHYVYFKAFGFDTEYKLPFYEEECSKYIATDGDGNEYYANPDEYFAEIFKYTYSFGETDFYRDTYEIKHIIENL